MKITANSTVVHLDEQDISALKATKKMLDEIGLAMSEDGALFEHDYDDIYEIAEFINRLIVAKTLVID